MKYSLKNVSTIIILSLLFINCKTVEINSVSKINKIENEINSIFAPLNQNGKFNGTVLVAKDDKIIYNKGFGFSNQEKKALLKPINKFNIGSIYKEIPAIAIMQLKENKLLDLNHSINKYLKGLPNWSNQVTILNLLQYTSGLPKINWRKHPIINDESLMNDLFQISSLEFIPGESYLYTNYSPFLLTKIVENISHKNFTEYVNENILKPLKLKNSKFNKSFPYEDRNSMAISFNSEYVEDNPPFIIKSSIFLFSTTTKDLFNLLNGIHSYELINENSLNIISKNADLNIDDMESAMGNVTFLEDKIIKHMHHGSTGNYECVIYKDILKNNTIIILTNSKNGNVHTVKNSILKILK